MTDLSLVLWSGALLFAWLAGEYLDRIRIPRIVTYGMIGFVFGEGQRRIGLVDGYWVRFLADASMGLLLCELGFRSNLSWLLKNRWALAASIVESLGTFFAILCLCYFWVGLEFYRSSVVACLCVATSPGAILRITRNAQSSGPITNAIVNFTAMNCLMAILLFKVCTGLGLRWESANDVIYPGVISVIVFASLLISVLLAIGMKIIMRPLRLSGEVRAFAVASSVIFLTLLLNHLRLSPSLGAIATGFAMRTIGIKMTGIHQDFGSLGRSLNILLFVFIGSRIEADAVWQGFALGILLGVARASIKVLVVAAMATRLGISQERIWLPGMALLPASAFAVSLLEQAKWMGVDRLGDYPPLVAMLFVFEILGPLGTSLAIDWSKEIPEDAK